MLNVSLCHCVIFLRIFQGLDELEKYPTAKVVKPIYEMGTPFSE